MINLTLSEGKIKLWLIVSFVLIMLIYLFIPLKIIGYFLYLFFPLLVCIAAYKAYKSYGANTYHGRSIRLIFFGCVCVFLAESIVFFLKHVYHISTFPNISNIFDFTGMLLIMIGLFFEIKNNYFDIKLPLKIIIIVSLIVVCIVIAYLVRLPDVSPMTNFANMVFRPMQFILLSLIVILFFLLRQVRSGRIYYPWFFIIIGMLINFIGSIFLAFFTSQYYTGDHFYILLVDTAWIVGYIFISYGFFILSDIIGAFHKNIQTKIKLIKNLGIKI